MIRRQGWAIAWRARNGKPARMVDAHGGLMIYSLKHEADRDHDPDSQKIIRVIITEKAKP